MDDDDCTNGSLPGIAIDLDFMDEFLNEGCWLKTADDCNFSQPGLSTSFDLNGPSPLPYIHFVDNQNSGPSVSHRHQISQQESCKDIPDFAQVDQLVSVNSQSKDAVESASSPGQSGSFSVERWIRTKTDMELSSSVRIRLLHAIMQLKESTKDRDVLVQIWVPVNKGGMNVLTTVDQPFFLDPKCKSLAYYRNVSEDYHFPVEEGSKDYIGLPGRAFLRKLPESTPDVRFFRTSEYPRKIYAKKYEISGSLAVPVFEQVSRTCLGVVEVVTTTQKMNYRPELEDICHALKAVDLKSAEDFCPPSVKACKEFCQAAVPEITEILETVCKSYRLPLALTWARCFHQGRGGCRHFDENFSHCISTVDSACFVADRELRRFHAACSEQFLTFGQGIVGRAFEIDKQSFESDITAFSKTDYPLAHHAKMFHLHAAIAVPLRSNLAGSAEFVLELFLPRDCVDITEQGRMWELLPASIGEACRSLHVIMDKDIQGATSQHIIPSSDERFKGEQIQNTKMLSFSCTNPSPNKSLWTPFMMQGQQKGKGACVVQDCPREPRTVIQWGKNREMMEAKPIFSSIEPCQQDHERHGRINGVTDRSYIAFQSADNRKSGEKRRTKAEKLISLETLRHYFAGSLKDAAKSLGVCPTTLKRICRQHGITRWPSRKIKKVGHSLKKLQLVIDSVQGAEGAIQIRSFYTTFPELTSPKDPGNGPSSSFTMFHQPEKLVSEQEAAGIPSNAATASSGSQSSESNKSCSSAGDHPVVTNDLAEDPRGKLNRTQSDANLHTFNHEEPKVLARSQSHKTFDDRPLPTPTPTSVKNTDRSLQGQVAFKVKATFGEDKTRFSMKPTCDFRELQQEIAKRFSLGELVSRITFKYLDDDNEWVLLTCDPDLEECKDIYVMSNKRTIKISLHHQV